ncbi:MAG: hypothetical protein Q9220_007086 [cf. Caloplaca sp. 1 TL-2023]
MSTNIALIRRWDFASNGPTHDPVPGENAAIKIKSETRKPAQRSMTISEALRRLRFGYNVTTSHRNIRTPYVVKNTPPYSTTDPAFIPSRLAFCLRKAWIILSTYLIIDLVSQQSQPLEVNARMYSADRVRIMTGAADNLSLEMVLTRFATVLSYWFCTAIVIDAFSSFFNFVMVALCLEPVEVYRPNFGSVSEAYTVRQFWGVTWHQMLRKHFSAPASVVVHQVLGLRKGGLVARYTHLFLVFLISGLMHTWVEVGQGFTWQESGQLHFFMTQVLGIVLEDGVQAIFRRWKGISRGKETSLGRRTAGYLWVMVFLWWSTPAWFYTRLRTSDGGEKEKVLPFSLIGYLSTRT